MKKVLLFALLLAMPSAFAQQPSPTTLPLSIAPISTATPSTTTSSSSSEVLGFKDWKASRVEDARAALERIALNAPTERAQSSSSAARASSTGSKNEASGKSVVTRVQKNGKTESRLQQAQLMYEIATELSVNDYFVLYLSQFNNESAFLEAIKKMSAEEIAELMAAYKKQLEGGRSAVGMLPNPMRGVQPQMGSKASADL